jgi:hypothetical protein
VLYLDTTCVENAEKFFDRVPAGKYYDHRALVVAGETDYVLLNSPVDSSYLEYLNRFGLGPDPSHVFALDNHFQARGNAIHPAEEKMLETLASAINAGDTNECTLIPYLHHRRIAAIAKFLSGAGAVRISHPEESIDVAHRYSSKAECRKLAESLEIPLPKGILFETDPEDVVRSVSREFHRQGALVLKGMWGNGGSETRWISAGWSESSLADGLSNFTPGSPLIVEEAIEPHLATNIMLHIDGDTGEIMIVGVSDQLIGKNIFHLGNTFPTHSQCKDQIVASSRQIAEALRREAFCGFAGVDFMETLPGTGATPQHFFLEVNPRVNASLHPFSLMHRLNELQRRKGNPEVRAFQQLSIPVAATSFTEVRNLLDDDAFHPESGRGVLLFSPAFLKAGALFLVLLGANDADIKVLHASVTGKLNAATFSKTQR